MKKRDPMVETMVWVPGGQIEWGEGARREITRRWQQAATANAVAAALRRVAVITSGER